MLTAEQIANWKRAKKKYERELGIWNPRLSRWRREIESSPIPERTEAWQQLKSLADAQAVPSLEQMFRKAGPELQLQVVATLGNIQKQVATDALVRLAVDCKNPDIRRLAAGQLSSRSRFEFVPNLLGRLEAPIDETSYLVKTIQRVQARKFIGVHTHRKVIKGVRDPRTLDEAIFGRLVHAHSALVYGVRIDVARQNRKLVEARRTVQVANARAATFNQRIYSALQNSTGEQIEDRPDAWWKWWHEHCELQANSQQPDVQMVHDTKVIYGLSSLLAGSQVWTESGPVPIERVRPGDRVLSQDPDSGELAYQMVLGTTIRPPSPTLRIQVADECIVATLGHPLWVIGTGWRMAKELKAGDQLHGVRGGMTIDQIEPGPTFESYNLVVADTNTYFVGKHRALVHDNMPRRAMDLPVPGWGIGND